MARRIIPIITDQIYHVFNRSIAGQPIFRTSSEYQLFIDAVEYYKFSNAVLRFSHYLRLDDKLKTETLNSLYIKSKTEIDIYMRSALCLTIIIY